MLSHRATLVLLLTAAAVQQVRYVARAVLPAQDVVDVVSVAQRIERDGLPATLRAEPVPPLFPALVAATHSVLSRCGVIDVTDWIRPPQTVAAAALILAVIPIFLTADRFAGRGPAVIATIFYITLPALARLGADGLGDAVHLCFVAWSAWLLSASRWTLAGLCIAAALWVRAEAAVVPLTILLLAVPRSAFRMPRFFAATACYVLPFLAVGVTSPGEIVERLRGGAAPTESVPLNDQQLPAPYWLTGDVGYVPPGLDAWRDAFQAPSLTFGHKDRSRSSRFHGLLATLREFADELMMASSYVLPLLVGAGFWFRRKSGWSNYDVFAAVAVGLQMIVLFGMAWKNGYLSTRHFAVPIVLTLPYAGMGLSELCRIVVMRTARREPSPPVYVAISFVGMFVLVSLIATAWPLHESMLAHRQAAEWLQTSAQPGEVLDQQGFTALASGRTTYRFDAAETAFYQAEMQYVVVERGDLEIDSARGRSLQAVLGDADRAEKTFAAPRGRTERDVLVFKRPPGNIATARDFRLSKER